MKKYREALEEMVWQFAYKGVKNGKSVLHTGGLSALENAFEALGWSDPYYTGDLEGVICDVKGCAEFATSGGMNWHDKGYWRLCHIHGFSQDICPEMKQRALDREASRGDDGCLPMK